MGLQNPQVSRRASSWVKATLFKSTRFRISANQKLHAERHFEDPGPVNYVESNTNTSQYHQC